MSRVIGAVLISALLLCNGASAQQTVKLLANTSPPYSDQNLPEQGLAMELVNHIFQRAGYSTEIKFDSWSRAMQGVDLGLYDALAAAWHTESRAQKFLYSDPYLSSRLVLVKLRTDPRDYYILKHLAGRRLGIRSDYSYGIDFGSIRNLKLVQENHAIQNLLDLLSGKVDLVIGDQRTLAMQINEYLGQRVQEFQVVDMQLPERARHVAATRAIAGEDKMIAAFNRALAETIKDGSHAAIIAKWDKQYAIPAAN